MLAFEGALEGLIVERDDAVALRRSMAILDRALNLNATIVRALLATKTPSRELASRARSLQDIISRAMSELHRREARLREKIDPELQRIVTETDRALDDRRRDNNIFHFHPERVE